MMPRNVFITKSKVLLVEGNDEVVFFETLLKHMDMSLFETIQVIPYEGKAKLDDFVSMISKTEGFIENVTSLGITRDADKNHDSAVDSINHTLKKYFGISTVKHNSFLQNESIRAGVYVLPGFAKCGELEDLVLSSVSGNDVFNLVEQYLAGLKDVTKPIKADSLFEFPRKHSKAKVQIYFSSMKESDTRTGISAQRKYVDFEHLCFNEIKDFLKNL